MLPLNPKFVQGLGETQGPEFHFQVGEWIDIPTENKPVPHTLNDILIVPGKNIVVDLNYAGPLRCRDMDETYQEEITGPIDFLLTNPIFNSENLRQPALGKYQFRTRLPTGEVALPSLQVYAALTEEVRVNYGFHPPLPADFIESIKGANTSLPSLLHQLHDFVSDIVVSTERDPHCNDFQQLQQEYAETGKIQGNCNEISTYTTGLARALGLLARRVDGDIFSEVPAAGMTSDTEIQAYRAGHAWSEVFIPPSAVWIPLDPSLSVLQYPAQTYAYSNVALPAFCSPQIKKAQLRIRYE